MTIAQNHFLLNRQTQKEFIAHCPSIKEGQTVILTDNLPVSLPGDRILTPVSLLLEFEALAPLAAGRIVYINDIPALRITSRFLLPAVSPQTTCSGHLPAETASPVHASTGCFAIALTDLAQGEHTFTPSRDGISLAWVTLSDKGAAGLRKDESGPLIKETLEVFLPITHAQGFILPDIPERLRALVCDLAHHQGFDLIVTTGGTGLGPRDTTPEAISPLLARRLPGFEQAMMAASLIKTPNAALSRAICGTIGQTIILCLPGSKKAVRENLEVVGPALAHAISKLQGDKADCGHP